MSTDEPRKLKLKKDIIPQFLVKLYDILEKSDYENIISWEDNGKAFAIKNLNEFTEKILPKYFKHKTYSSFVRQLNMYDFHKKRSTAYVHIYMNKNFIRGQRNLMKTIKRKTNPTNPKNRTETADPNEYYKEISSKKMTKKSLEVLYSKLHKNLEDMNCKQGEIESKVIKLGQQNEEFLNQNQQMIKEIVNKTDYNLKLESLLFFILEILVPKNPLGPKKGNEGQILPSSLNFLQIKDNNNIFNINNSNNILKQTIESLGETFFKTIFDKYRTRDVKATDLTQKQDEKVFPMLVEGIDDRPSSFKDFLQHKREALEPLQLDANQHYNLGMNSPNPSEELNFSNTLFTPTHYIFREGDYIPNSNTLDKLNINTTDKNDAISNFEGFDLNMGRKNSLMDVNDLFRLSSEKEFNLDNLHYNNNHNEKHPLISNGPSRKSSINTFIFEEKQAKSSSSKENLNENDKK